MHEKRLIRTKSRGGPGRPLSRTLCVSLLSLTAALDVLPVRAGSSHSPEASDLLEGATAIITEGIAPYIAPYRTNALQARLAILESLSDTEASLSRARAIEDPFYASLALGGIAAWETDASLSTEHYLEALARAGKIRSWTGSYATSFGFIIELIPSFPDQEARELLGLSRTSLFAWDASEYQKSRALLSLSKATIIVEPSAAHELLFKTALKSNHYWESIECLAAFLAGQDLKTLLDISEEYYREYQDWPNDQYLRRAVLIELSRTDFEQAFSGIRQMRPLDGESASVQLAEFMIEQDREDRALEVVTYLESLHSDHYWIQSSLKELRGKLDARPPSLRSSISAPPEEVDRFLANPGLAQLEHLVQAHSITFRNRLQVQDFIRSAQPLSEEIIDRGYPHHGSMRSSVLSLLTVCAARTGRVEQALQISRQISIPELRAGALLDAYESLHPVPESLSGWPLDFQGRRCAIQEP